MDVPARQSYVMAVVPPEERAAAAGVTNVPRSLASAFAPLPAGALLDYSLFGWPLILGGACKLVYDALLLIQFRSVRLPDELPVKSNWDSIGRQKFVVTLRSSTVRIRVVVEELAGRGWTWPLGEICILLKAGLVPVVPRGNLLKSLSA